MRAVEVRSKSSHLPTEWHNENGAIGDFVRQQRERTLNAYRANPKLVSQDANQERDLERGGYADRQVLELVQNAADTTYETGEGRIQLHLAGDYLYCADDGAVIDEEGLEALLFAYLSPKRGTDRIGRFGLGFKSVLGVTDAPEFYSRSGSLSWSRQQAAEEISAIAPGLQNYPTLRVAYTMDPIGSANSDAILNELMEWATNIVRLPLSQENAAKIHRQLEEFPKEFLLFVPHVRSLEIIDELGENTRRILCDRQENDVILFDGNSSSTWMVANVEHRLSAEAIADERTPDDDELVKITWAAPRDRLNEPGQFWAYFPTLNQSLVAGILNAPWKTNEDRQNLLEGPYNRELIAAMAKLVANSLSLLATKDDPARHLIALPRRHETGDSDHADILRQRIYQNASTLEIVPDQLGGLRRLDDVKYPPQELIADGNAAQAALQRWESLTGHPSDWLHHSGINQDRLARLRLLWGTLHNHSNPRGYLPQEDLGGWLEALVYRGRSAPSVTIEGIEASKAAVQTAALIPLDIRQREYLGDIVLTSDGRWVEPDPKYVFLAGSHADEMDGIVHPDLENDPLTREALLGLGIRVASGSAVFEQFANEILSPSPYSHPVGSRNWHRFWLLVENVDLDTATAIIQSTSDQWRDVLQVKTMDGEWHTLHESLLPGPVVSGDGSRDDSVTIDVGAYHTEKGVALLKLLGVADRPIRKFPHDPRKQGKFISTVRQEFIEWHQLNGSTPRDNKVVVRSSLEFISGPLTVLSLLSKEAAAVFTWKLLLYESTLSDWSVSHNVWNCWCSPKKVPSPAITELSQHGYIETPAGLFPLKDGVGDPPDNPAVRQRLLEHPNIEQIRLAFDVPEILATTEQDESEDKLLEQQDDLVEEESDAVAAALRQLIRTKYSSDAERLLEAVGESELRQGLPNGLVAILENEKGEDLSRLEIAEAAISTFHTGTLEEYRSSLTRLNPPRRWAGGPQAIAFVQSLGFNEEWAGSRSTKRDPFEQVDGPFTLPDLHYYQRKVVRNVRGLLTSPAANPDRRGMISMPTGSGKTRVAVQAIVESIRDDGIKSGILWVADRDELCEQAVQAWREVWASEGADSTQLRISRMWQGQQAPLPVSDYHVVVASIQTLTARLEHDAYRFLAEFELIVFDEAHRSIAPSFTSVMEELGLTRYRRAGEPIIVGLTATPYRGHDREETARFVNRYGANRLDAGTFASDDPEDVVRELQEMHVLAQADHETIQGGRFTLDANELSNLRTFSRLPESAEQRIGRDAGRTRRILDAYHEHIDPNWPTLVFATSVEHSKIVAAMLNRAGITARAVWGDTKPSVRRGIVEEFRSGKIQALVNYGVFREGFDAPKTRAIVVARPVYSPNLYFQMIGRGLRGRLNGGNDRCLILNVEDNIDNYEGRLAFSDLDWLWEGP